MNRELLKQKLEIATEWIRLADAADNLSITFRGILEIGESSSAPDDSTPLLRLENEMATIAVDSMSWVRVPADLQEKVTVYIL